jgi:carbamoyl-phosphate synthase large subunit
MNILITSIGKRVRLVKFFQDELRNFSSELKIFTTDMNPLFAPAGVFSDKCFKAPKVTEPGYIDFLINLCSENSIRLIIPTIDTELLVLSENKKIFQKEKIEILVADENFVSICQDKRKTDLYFKRLGIRTPKPIDKYHPTFPLFAKPYDGSLSHDIYIITEEGDLTPAILNHPKLLFMEYIDNNEYKEFTVDMYYGRDNQLKSVVPRERIEIRAGEISKGYTRKNYLVRFLKEHMNYLPGIVGCICIQLFYREMNDDVIGIEINPRFGGGYPLSYYAKANFPLYIIKEYLLNESLSYSEDWLNNTLMLRYDSEVIIYEK